MSTPLDVQRRRDTLCRGFGMLQALEFCRVVTRRPSIGVDVEKALLDAALQDLEMCTLKYELETQLTINRALEKGGI